jgi:hypothetical protein
MHNTVACRDNAVPGQRLAAAPCETEFNRTVVAEIGAGLPLFCANDISDSVPDLDARTGQEFFDLA